MYEQCNRRKTRDKYSRKRGKVMIIVSQDKKTIINFESITRVSIVPPVEKGYKYSIAINGCLDLGYYETEERAKEVLQELVKTYSSYLTLNGGPALLQGQTDIAPAIFNIPKVYEMPEK